MTAVSSTQDRRPGTGPDDVILIGIGGNLATAAFGPPIVACRAALERLVGPEIAVVSLSSWYESAPVPASDQPWFVNAVAALDTALPPGQLLEALHDVEAAMGRTRRIRNEARIVDLDLLAHGRRVDPPPAWPILPHPRLAERAFVLYPLAELVPGWRLPGDGRTVETLIAALPSGQIARRLTPPP